MQFTTLVAVFSAVAGVMASPISEKASALEARAACPSKVTATCAPLNNVYERVCKDGQWQCAHINPLTLSELYRYTWTPTGVSCSQNGAKCS